VISLCERNKPYERGARRAGEYERGEARVQQNVSHDVDSSAPTFSRIAMRSFPSTNNFRAPYAPLTTSRADDLSGGTRCVERMHSGGRSIVMSPINNWSR
jgi:hypothetical protein